MRKKGNRRREKMGAGEKKNQGQIVSKE